MKRFIIILSILLLLTPSISTAAGEVELGQVVVTATRIEEAVENVPSSVTVITSEDFGKKQATTVLEVLRGVPGLDVVQSGGPGKTASVFIRGGNSDHTLVMIDGVQVNSPTLGSYNFADLTVDGIERIEIIRGPQSTLYGSDAMAGVINIITKRGKGAPKFTISAEGGTYDTYRETASVSGSRSGTSYNLSVSRLDTDGFSAASEKNGNTEDDGHENTTVSARLGRAVGEKADLNVTVRYSSSETDLDSFGSDDPNYTQESDELVASARLNHYVSDRWDHSLKLSLARKELDYRDPDTSWNNSSIDTKIKTVDWQHNLYSADETHTVTVGVEYEKQEGRNPSAGFDRSVDNRAIYLQDQVPLLDGRLNVTAGARYDDHSEFGNETTYRLAFSYLVDDKTRLKGSWGKGFKAPTLNDLYYRDPWGSRGNPDLEPEKSRGYDLGIEFTLPAEGTKVAATYFRSDYDNLIEWVEYAPWAYEPQNVAEAKAEGWEFGLETKPTDTLDIKASYTITDTENETTGKELARRPKNKGSIAVGLDFDRAGIVLSVDYVGKRWSDSKNTKRLDSYTRVNLAASCIVTGNWTVFGRIENLTDEEYEEVKGYGTAGRSYYAGVKATF